MKHKLLCTTILIIALCCIGGGLSAQEQVIFSSKQYYLLGRFSNPVENKYSPDWEKIDQYNINDIIPAPFDGFPLLNTDSTENISIWMNLVYDLVKSILVEPHNYGDYVEKEGDIYPYMIAYGLIANGNYKQIYAEGFSEKANILFPYFTKDENAIKLLVYLKPAIVWSLACMSKPSYDGYKHILIEAKNYARNLKKIEFYNSELNFCKQKEGFTYKDADGNTDPCRKIKAFIFRRYVDFKAKSWSSKQIDDFNKNTDYLPKPSWGMSLENIEKYCELLEDWF